MELKPEAEPQQAAGNRSQEAGNGEYRFRKGHDIAERLLDLTAAVLRLIPAFPADPGARNAAIQLARSISSPGANYAEARAAESRADFIHKVSIAAKEMHEGSYWLALVARAGWLDKELAPLVREAEELTAILAASARTARARSRRR
jgi:four helix bundle protein